MRTPLLGLAALASLSLPALAQARRAPAPPRPDARTAAPTTPATPTTPDARRAPVVLQAVPAPAQAPRAPEADPDRGVIGVFLGPNDTTGREGARVNGLVEDGPAAGAGLRVGDRILAIGDTETPNVSALMTAMRGRRAGETLSLTVERDGWRKRVDVELGAAGAPRELAQVAPEDVQFEEIEEIEEIEVAEEPVEMRELRRLIESREGDASGDDAGPRSRREWVEVREGDDGERHVRRRVWIDGEEVEVEEFRGGDAGSRRRSFGDDGDDGARGWIEVHVETDGARDIDEDELRRSVLEWVERREDAQRRRRVERAERFERAERRRRADEELRRRDRMEVRDRERVEREQRRQRRERTERADRAPRDASRGELERRDDAMHELRAEVEALHAEIRALRAELERLRAGR